MLGSQGDVWDLGGLPWDDLSHLDCLLRPVPSFGEGLHLSYHQFCDSSQGGRVVCFSIDTVAV